jgi:hypothetical protein
MGGLCRQSGGCKEEKIYYPSLETNADSAPKAHYNNDRPKARNKLETEHDIRVAVLNMLSRNKMLVARKRQRCYSNDHYVYWNVSVFVSCVTFCSSD